MVHSKVKRTDMDDGLVIELAEIHVRSSGNNYAWIPIDAVGVPLGSSKSPLCKQRELGTDG